MIHTHRLAFRIAAAVALLILFSPSNPLAATFEVGPAGYPYTAIQDAIDDAVNGDTVLVHDGTYIENINFNDKAISVRSQNGPASTVIDGGGGGSVVTFNSGEGEDSILDGFTVQNGNATNGGGIHIQNSSPTITHCRISGNNASSDGGGIYCIKQPNPPTDCAPTIEDSTISGNHANGSGGGIAADLYARPVFRNCIVESNSATSGGGIDSYGAFPEIYDCTISDNTATSLGGGIYAYNQNPVIVNTIIAGNSQTGTGAGRGGGGIACSECEPFILNCTIYNNSAASCGGAILSITAAPVVINSILWNNSDVTAGFGEICLIAATIDITYSDIEGGYAGTGNIDADPVFADAAGENFRLEAGSPCIDNGTATGAPEYDFEGNPRLASAGGDDQPDMGADEYYPSRRDVGPPGSGYAYTSVQTAVDDAVSGDEIFVHDGTYLENIDYNGKAIAIRSENGAAQTILHGDETDCVVAFQSGEGGDSVLDGFTVQNGANRGGIAIINGSSPGIANCIVKDSSAEYFGGGIYIYNGSSPAITGCTVSDNTADYGGGIFFWQDCSPTISGSTITRNTATYEGGGIYAEACGEGTPDLVDLVITDNIAQGSDGGGIACSSCSPTVTNCIVADNAADDGGGMYVDNGSAPMIVNSTLAGNTAGGDGGGICCVLGGAPTVVNSILYDDSAAGLGPEVHLRSGTSIAISYSDVAGGYAGTGNINDPPQFMDAAGGDFHLQPTSPCINQGNLGDAPPYDFEGDPRLIALGGDNQPDMGADEVPSLELHVGKSGYPYTSIQAAIDDAQDGYTVVVHDGTFTERIDFNGKAITVQSENGPYVTVIDGDAAGTVVTFDSNEGMDSVLDGFTIQHGVATVGSGGGIFIVTSASPTIANCIVRQNSASSFGGGFHIAGYAAPRIVNCAILENDAVYGGGINCGGGAAPIITHCTILNNRAVNAGGGIYGFNFADIRVENCILWGDTAGGSPDAVSVNFSEGGSIFIGHSDIQGGYTGSGNIDADPLFLDSEMWGFHLSPDSPCIDAGTDTALYPPASDFEGDPNPYDGDNNGTALPDMGADEYVHGRDLAIESIVVTPTFPQPDEPFTVRVTVENKGSLDINDSFRCAFSDGALPIPSWEYWTESGLAAGESVSRQFDFEDGRSFGSYVLRADSDWDGDVDELSELNNYDMVLVVVGWCQGDYDGDGDVDGADLKDFEGRVESGDLSADLDNSGVVDEADVGLFADHFGRADCATPLYGGISLPVGMGVLLGAVDDLAVSLSAPAPAGGVTVHVTSDNPGILSVNPPGTVFIPAGQTEGTVTINGLALGTVTVRGNGTGYTAGEGQVQVVSGFLSVAETLDVPLLNEISIPITIAPDPAPAGGLVVNLSSSDPSTVEVITPTVTIPEGEYSQNGRIKGAAPGPATITASQANYLEDSCQATTVANLNIIESSATLNTSFSTDITIRLESAGTPTAAPEPGVSVTLVPDNPGCVALSSPATIPAGQVSTTVTLSYGGSAVLPCTSVVTASAPDIDADTIDVTVNPTPGIAVYAPATVGSGLQQQGSFTLGAGEHGGVSVRIESSNASVALVSPDASTPGTAFIDVPVADGSRTAYFHVQGVATGSVTITVSATGFTDGTDTTEIVQPAVRLGGLLTTSTTLSPDDPFYVRVGIPSADNSTVSSPQAVRAGAGVLTATVVNSVAGVGQLTTTATTGQSVTVEIAEGSYDSPTSVAAGGAAFDPLASGTTTVSATIAGFIATDAAAVEVTVSSPGIAVYAPATVGSGLQQQGSFTLGAGEHGGVSVRIESSNASVALVSPDASTPGTAFIDVPVADGSRTVYFHVQGVATGSVTITVSATGFTDGTDTTEIVQPAVRLGGLLTTSTTLSPDDPFYVRVGIPSADNSTVSSPQAVRAGAGVLTATVVNSVAGVGQLTTTATTGQSVTVEIAEGSYDSPTSVAAGGAAFDPLASGTTTVSATIAGFIATDAAAVEVTVSSPGIAVYAPATVGSGLQQQGSFTLGAGEHGGVSVRIESSNASVALVSPDASTPGTAFIDVPVADGSRTAYFHVQGVATGSVTITVSATGFTDGTDTTEIVQPAVRLGGLLTTSTTLSPDDPFYVRVGIPSADNSTVSSPQAVRAGAGVLTATVVNSVAGVGQLTTTATTGQSVTVEIAEGSYDSPTSVAAGGAAFDPLASGTTTVSATIAGFIATDAAAVEVTVSSPGIAVYAPATVGSGLQQQGSFTLGAGEHGGVSVRIESSNASVALVSPDASTPGTAFIDVPVADGSRTVYFHVQGVATGSVTITVSATGFTDGTDTTEIVQPAVRLGGLLTTSTTLSPDDPFYVRVGIPSADNSTVSSPQAVRAGAGVLTATVVNSVAGVGQLTTTATTGQSVTVEIAEGSYDSPTSVAAGGAAFDPLASGTTTVSATIAGFIATDAAAVEVTVTEE